MTQADAQTEGYSKVRVEAYTDAVFAIAATLLVLGLTANAIGDVRSDSELWSALAGMHSELIAFAVSFALLSLLWVVHLQLFREVARIDSLMLWLNNARLLFVVLIPFTTSLNASYQDFYAGRMLLPINFFFAALLGHLAWVWAASRSGHLLRKSVSGEQKRRDGDGGLAAVICGAVAMLLSPWLGSVGFLAYAFSRPVELGLRRLRAGSASRRG